MITTILFFNEIRLDRLFKILNDLPEEVKPKYFSDSENIKNKKNLIANEKRFQNFVEVNPLGFFLFGEQSLFNLSFHTKGNPELSLDLDNTFSYQKVSDLLLLLFELSPVFGFASVWEEYTYRNKLYWKDGKNSNEGWVGRDLEKYLSGIYWISAISDQLLEKFEINLDHLISHTIFHKHKDNLHLLKFYDDPDSWKEFVNKLDDLCVNTNGIFSKKPLDTAVKRVTSLLDYYDILGQWK